MIDNLPTDQETSPTYKNKAAYATMLQEIDKKAVESHLKRLFIPEATHYVRNFSLTEKLADNPHATVWDVGCGPSGKHLLDLTCQFPDAHFFGVNPHIQQSELTFGTLSVPLASGIVEELDTEVAKQAEERGVPAPDIILLSNVLRHVSKAGEEGFARSLQALYNTLKPDGTVCIIEDVKAGPGAEKRVYEYYEQTVQHLGIPFACEIVANPRGLVKTRLELHKKDEIGEPGLEIHTFPKED